MSQERRTSSFEARIAKNTTGALKGRSPDRAAALLEHHHRFANDLALITGLIRLQTSAIAQQKREFSAADVAAMLVVLAGRIDAVSVAHRAIGDADAVDLGHVVRAVCEPLVSSLAPLASMAVSFEIEAGCRVQIDHAVPVALIIGEAVANALRHSHPAGVAGRLLVGCRREAGQALLIEITDDGVGLPEGFNAKTDGAVGFKVIRALSKQINAKFAFDSRPTGLRFRLRVRCAV